MKSKTRQIARMAKADWIRQHVRKAKRRVRQTEETVEAYEMKKGEKRARGWKKEKRVLK